MSATTEDINRQVAEFDARHGAEGLLLRYARGRVKSFPGRQVLMLLGVLALAVLISPGAGALAGVFALAGEGIDCGYLAWLARRMERGQAVRQARFVSTLTAAAQAAGIAGCVTLAWVAAPGRIASAPALALLAAATINAGIVLPFHRSAALIRFAVFGATALALVTADFLAEGRGGLHAGFDAVALMVLAYVCYMFVAFIVRGHAQQVARAREMLLRGRELARARAGAERAAEARARFLATMSHEIRTPMNGIIGMAELLGEAGLSGETRQYAETIRRSGEALLTIINDILDFSKLEAGKPATHAVEFELMRPLDEAVALLRPGARKKGIFLDVVAGEGLPARVVGDDGRLRQILLNVIGNAVKFTARGGVTVTVSQREAEGDALALAFAVKDSGIGIAPARLGGIFEAFAQADAAVTRDYGGTGLGLAISRLLAREMGGDITVASQPGAGALFTISLRFGRAEAGAAPGPPERAAAEAEFPAGLAGKTVLVAEDNRTNRLLLRKYLEDAPLWLHFATNGREAVEMAERHDPDIVLMDMAMPVMDGLAAARAIRAAARGGAGRPRILALTANAFAADRAACLAAGMDGFLTKPLRKAELLRQLSRGAAGPGGAPPFPLEPGRNLS